MDEVKKLREKYKDDEEFNEELYFYLTAKLPYDQYPQFVEEFIPVMNQYHLDDLAIDTIVTIVIKCHIGKFIQNELPLYISDALHNKMLYFNIILKVNEATTRLLNTKDFCELADEDSENAHGFNNGTLSIIELFEHASKTELMKTIIHESLHQVTHLDYRYFKKQNGKLEEKTGIHINDEVYLLTFSGVDVSFAYGDKKVRYYRKINEAITEYLTKKVMKDLYPKHFATYKKPVAILEELIEQGILNEDIIIDAYINNSIKMLMDEVYKKTGSYEPLQRFNNGYTPANYKKESFYL